jgi:hypothetical protein
MIMSINDTAAMPPNEWNADQSVDFLNVGKREEGAATSIWFFYHMKTNLSMFRFAVLMPFDILIGRIPFHHLGGITNLTEHQWGYLNNNKWLPDTRYAPVNVYQESGWWWCQIRNTMTGSNIPELTDFVSLKK